MKRSIAILSLSLALASSVFADERGFAKALEDWQALYRPLATARGSALTEAAMKVERDTDVLARAVRDPANFPLRDFHVRERDVVLANLEVLDRAYLRGDAREKRTLVRLAAILGERFGERDVPWYPTCGSGPFTVGTGAEALLATWFQKDPAPHLGLLEDPDPRVAEAAVRLLCERYRDEVTLRLEAWQRHPQARFRGIAVKWSHLLGENAYPAVLLGALDDSSEGIRDYAVATLPYENLKEVYRLRRSTFAKASWAQRRTILVMAGRVDAPERAALAQTCLQSKDASVLTAALDGLALETSKESAVSRETLARLRSHSNEDVRYRAYERSALQKIPMRDLRNGLNDPQRSVRLVALTACCEGIETVEEFRFLLDYALKQGETSDLPVAARRLGAKAVDSVLPFLGSVHIVRRTLGIEMATQIDSPRLLPELEKCLADPDPKIREALANGLTELPERVARPWLKKLAADPVQAVREQATYSLETLDQRIARANESP